MAIVQNQGFSDHNSWTTRPKFMFLGVNHIVLMSLTDEKRTKTSHSHLRWCRLIFRSHKMSLFPGNTVCFVRKSFRHDIPYISAECGFRRNMSTCYSHKFQESLHKISTWQPSQTSDVPNPEKKNFTNQPVDILFQQKWHDFRFPFRVNYSKLEMRISTIISKNKIQAKGFRMI